MGCVMEYKFYFTYMVDSRIKTATGDNDDFDIRTEEHSHGLKVTVLPKNSIIIKKFFVERDYPFDENSLFFANGYQSWTDSREFGYDDRMDGLGLIGKSLFGKKFGLSYVGDYNFVIEEKKRGSFHSHSFAYVREGDTIDFFGSMTERTGFTVIYADMTGGKVRFSKDIDGVTISEPYDVLDMYLDCGDYDGVFDRYFSALGVHPITKKKIKGYTSWYNYYQGISEDIILRDLHSLEAKKELVNTFQVDDGYQTAVGDWLSIDSKKFPNGMKKIADSIHDTGFEAGLWLAPFGAQYNSKLAKNHPDWLIKDKKGKPITVGANWGGFYALDIYNTQVREYIKNVFDTVLNEWGFDLVKLDFLYAASIVPMYNKSRGEIACDAIDFLRECVGNKKILGCGVQQMPCFGKVDYMRIGADMDLGWAHIWRRKYMHREDVSTPNAIHNSIYRRCLNGRAFLCDPDVFLLRRTNIRFSPEQQKVLSKFIQLFGGVLFMSDNIDDYDAEQMSVFTDIMSDSAELTAVHEKNGKVFVDYVQDGKPQVLKFSVSDGVIY